MNDGQLIQRLRELDRPIAPDPAFAETLFTILQREVGRRSGRAGVVERALALAAASTAVVVAAILVLGLLTGTPSGPAGSVPLPAATPTAPPTSSPSATSSSPAAPAGPVGWRQGAPPPFTVPTLIGPAGWREGDVWGFVVPPDPEAEARLVAYDVAQDEWTELGEVPFGTSLSDLAPTAAAFGPSGDILVFGHADGERGVWTIYAETLEATGPGPEVPGNDGGAPGFTVARTGPDGRIYLLETAGAPLMSPVSLVIYDPLLREWTEAPPVPTARLRPQLVVDPSGAAYVIGGSATTGDVATHLETVDRLDPVTGQWTDEFRLPSGVRVGGSRWGHAATWGPNDAAHVYSYEGGPDSPMEIYRLAGGGPGDAFPGPPVEPHNAVLAPDGSVVVVGHGHDTDLSGEQPLDEPVTWIWDFEEQP